MDVKGAVLNLSTIRSLYGIIGSFNYLDGFLAGVDGFNLNPLSKFKDEFPGVIKALLVLDQKIFSSHHLLENHEFVFHFENDVAEMDCATFLTIGGVPFFVDLEVKDTEHVEQLDEQFELRERDTLVQLNLSNNYLLIGFLNGNFEKAILRSSKERKEINSLDELINATSALSNEIVNLRLVLKDVESMLKIQDVNNRIASKEFKYFSATRDAIDSITTNLRNGKKIIIVYGNAGSGKTVVALSLFYTYQNLKLLILNRNLYSVLSLYRFYSNNLCFFGTNQFIDSLDSTHIAVIDECQRLSISDIARIASKAKAVVLLGDNNQAFTYSDSLLNEEELRLKLIEELSIGEDCIVAKRMKKTARYNSRVNKLLEVLHNNSPIIGYANEIKEKVGDEFAIDVTMAENEFISKYEGLGGTSRLYIPFSMNTDDDMVISGSRYQAAKKDDSSFSVANYYSHFIGNTYHAISFDVDNSFVVLKNVGITKRENGFYFYDKNLKVDNISMDDLKKYNNQINILFTRGRKSLHILTDDFYVFSYLNFKIKRGVR